MKQVMPIMIFMILVLISSPTISKEISNPNLEQIKSNTITLKPSRTIPVEKISRFLKSGEYGWSSIDKGGLERLILKADASHFKKQYEPKLVLDKDYKTTWAFYNKPELKTRLVVDISGILDTEATPAFTITTVGIIPGYSKTKKSWEENNRIKSATLVIYSKRDQADAWAEMEYTVYKLEFEDKMALFRFDIPEDKWVPNEYPMKKRVWLIIDEVYRGTKYNDTCISEILFAGGYQP